LAKPVAIKPEEQFARAYVDRLILRKLTEMESVVKLSEIADSLSKEGIGLATVRNLLASNEHVFTYNERRWVPSSRIVSVGRPFAGTVETILDRFGGPMSIELLTTEVARIRRQEPETVVDTLRRLLEIDRRFLITSNEEVALTAWGFRANDESRVRAFALNGITAETVEDIRAKLGDYDYRAEGAVKAAIQKLAPVSVKGLGAAFWTAQNVDDPRGVLIFDDRAFLRDVLESPDYVLGADGVIYPESETKLWISTAVRLAEKLAPSIEVDDAAPIEIKAEDLPNLVAKIVANEGTVTATKLLEENYEITPGTKTFIDDLANIVAALRTDSAVQWLGGDRFRRAGNLPDGILEVPQPFEFPATTVTDDEGEIVDIELNDDGLSTSLRKLLTHPLAMDVLDEDISPAPRLMPDTVRLALKAVHRELGTFPMCQLPTGYLENEPKIQELVIIDDQGRELSVWANLQARLIFGWIDWWFEQPVESGAVFNLTKTNKANTLEFTWLRDPDPVIFIESDRMEELREIGAEAEGKSTLDLLIQVMENWPKGADFLTLLAEVNVVRRSSRRLIASLLSSYQCFYQRSGSPVWHFDAKKLELGFDKTKRKFVKK
jgi:hypothetical protein